MLKVFAFQLALAQVYLNWIKVICAAESDATFNLFIQNAHEQTSVAIELPTLATGHSVIVQIITMRPEIDLRSNGIRLSFQQQSISPSDVLADIGIGAESTIIWDVRPRVTITGSYFRVGVDDPEVRVETNPASILCGDNFDLCIDMSGYGRSLTNRGNYDADRDECTTEYISFRVQFVDDREHKGHFYYDEEKIYWNGLRGNTTNVWKKKATPLRSDCYLEDSDDEEIFAFERAITRQKRSKCNIQ